MQIQYNGEHSLTFYDYRNADMNSNPPDIPHYNTWSSWHLIPTTPPYINPYSPKINQVEIPGSNGVIDLSESLNGSVLYERRTGEWEFILDSEKAGKNPWEMYHDIRNDIHGKWVVVVSPDLPLSEENKYRLYTGRISVADFNVGAQYATIKLSYNLGARNAAWISTGKKVGAQDVAWFIRENISDDWTPETFDDAGNGMIEDEYDHVVSEDQFQIEWLTPDGPMYEIEVDDDGTLIAEVPLPDIEYEEEIVFDDEGEWDPETSPFVMYTVRYLNDDGSLLREPESVVAGTVINPSQEFQSPPISQIESNALFIGWSEEDEVMVNTNLDIQATYDYELIYYKVKFYNDDNSYLNEVIVRAGTTAEYPGQMPPISAVKGDGYALFKGWSRSLDAVLSDMSVTAVYELSVRIRFYNDDGNPIIVDGNYAETIIPYGGTASYPYNENPVSTYDDVYGEISATFIGWDKSLSNLAPTKDELDEDGFYRIKAQYEYNNGFVANFIFVRDYGAYLEELRVDSQKILPGGTLDGTNVNVASPAAKFPNGDGNRLLGWSENMFALTSLNMPIVITKNINLYPVFSYRSIEETWESVFEAERDGSYRTKYHIGDRMPLRSNSGYVAWVMEIAAIDTDILSDNSGNAKITWICNTIWCLDTMNSSDVNSGGWGNSKLRDKLHNEVLGLYFPELIKNNIKEVKKTYYDSTTNSTLETNDKIWIPSGRELGSYPSIGMVRETSGVSYEWSYSPSLSGETYYPNTTRKVYYSDGIQRAENQYNKYWLRSAHTDNGSFYYVDSNGTFTGTRTRANFPMGVVFGFCT